jgi:hypothetical protein
LFLPRREEIYEFTNFAISIEFSMSNFQWAVCELEIGT